MKINILGSGGLNPPPRPGCQCRICKEARIKGTPYYRTRNSLFIYNESILIGLNDETRWQLNREDIDLIEYLILPEWNPSQSSSVNLLKTLNYDDVVDMPIWEPIEMFIPPVYDESDKNYRLLKKYEDELGIIAVHELHDCHTFETGNISITPVCISEANSYYFIIYNNTQKIVYIPQRYKELNLISEAYDPDILITFCHFWQNRDIFKREIANTSILENQASFEDNLETAKIIRAKKLLITGIEEDFGMSYRNLQILPKLKYPDYNLEFAQDGLIIDL